MTDMSFNATYTPRIAIMGEFSAGKSTLCNILMAGAPLPERVTATRLAPVWMTKGPGRHARVALDGTETELALEDLQSVPVEGTRYIRLSLDVDVLDLCDIIDFPGISDPNMDADVWERVLGEADAVIWLTHATQAWRQSEAAVWETVPEEVQERSILLITQIDKLMTEKDRARVVARVERETDGLFAKVFPISLLEAAAAREDYDGWVRSGAGAFSAHLVDLLAQLSEEGPVHRSTLPVQSAMVEAAEPVPVFGHAGQPAETAEAEAEPLRASHEIHSAPQDAPADGPDAMAAAAEPLRRPSPAAETTELLTGEPAEEVGDWGSPADAYEDWAEAPASDPAPGLPGRTTRNAFPSAPEAPRVLPRRVRPAGMSSRPRLPRGSSISSL